MEQKDLELRRVRTAIAGSILEFLEERLRTGRVRFHAEDLHVHVARQTQRAPGSADRVLRLLRADGFCVYTLVSRSQSLYEVVSVGERRAA